MADKRISALTEKTSLGASDYLVTDNASEAASKKVKTSYITDQLAAMQNVYGAKNLVPYPYNDTTKAEDGLTFTDNGDGSVTINGTSSRASGYTYFIFSERHDGDLILPIGNYTYSMEIVSGSITSGEVKALVEKYNGVPGTSDGWAVIETLTNASISSDFSLSAERNMAVMLRIKFGASLSNLRIRPMIRLASIKDSTYAMYAKTNKQITDELGSTDISSIGNGTVTGGISSLNSALRDIRDISFKNVPSGTSITGKVKNGVAQIRITTGLLTKNVWTSIGVIELAIDRPLLTGYGILLSQDVTAFACLTVNHTTGLIQIYPNDTASYTGSLIYSKDIVI